MKIIEINSLSEFMEYIGTAKSHYFRGENKNNGVTKNISSGYRWMLRNNKSFKDLLNLRLKFYQEIGYRLSTKDIENFIAYSQHHTLPTELIDVTENPLVALYFACENDTNPDKEGYVYAINKEDSVELGKKLITSDISKQVYNFTEFIANPLLGINYNSKDHENFTMIISNPQKMLEYIKRFPPCESDFFFDSLNSRNSFAIPGSAREGILRKINTEMNNALKDEKINYHDILSSVTCWHEATPTFFSYEDIGDEEAFNICLAVFAFDIFNKSKKEIPFIKYTLHQPSVIFDRMVNQQGKFIYQNHFIGKNNELIIQKIIPEHTVKISSTNKIKILHQLDNIGINRKFIYPDHDNIAQYITQKFSD